MQKKTPNWPGPCYKMERCSPFGNGIVAGRNKHRNKNMKNQDDEFRKEAEYK
jgi:hypothetical protein